MLTDLGLQSPEEIDKFNEFRKARANSMFNGIFHGGCVSTDLCKNCSHLFSDSTCLCAGLGKCTNCGFDNSPKIEYKLNTSGILNPPFLKLGYSKDDFIKLADKVFSAYKGDYDYDGNSFLKDLKEEINKL